MFFILQNEPVGRDPVQNAIIQDVLDHKQCMCFCKQKGFKNLDITKGYIHAFKESPVKWAEVSNTTDILNNGREQ